MNGLIQSFKLLQLIFISDLRDPILKPLKLIHCGSQNSFFFFLLRRQLRLRKDKYITQGQDQKVAEPTMVIQVIDLNLINSWLEGSVQINV